MADDLDAELLALAGDSSDEEASPASKERVTSPTRSSSPQSPNTSTTMGRKGTARPVKRGRKSRRNDEEDGEISAAESLDSASMSESDSGSDSEGSAPEAEDEGPIFPYEKLYYSVKDKEEIMAMPEIQREQILSERAQQVDRHNQDLALRRLLASREREEARKAKKNKRKASVANLDEGNRKSSRQKMTLGGRKVGETSDAIEAYKRQREQKGKRDELRRREPVKDQKARSRDDRISDEDAEGESEVEWDDRERSPSLPKDDPPVELRDIQRARVGRTNFAQVCFYPGFDDAISGCYARVNIGPNRETGQNEYRLCLIKRFTEGKPYAMEGQNGRSFVTNQYAVLAHGKAEREFPFVACSDSPFTEAEFNRYRQTMAVEDCKMATRSAAANKVTDINRLLNHKFTNEELNEKLRKQGSLDTKSKFFRRVETEKQLKLARAAGDDAEAERLEGELASMSTPKVALNTGVSKPRADKPSEHERLAELNLRNQKLNYENVRRAQLEERKASRKAAAAVARGEATLNPFMRVRTQARTHYDVNGNGSTPKPDSNASQDNTASETPSKASTPARSATPASTQKRTSKGGVASIRHRNMDDENIAALDLELDIEI
ncbi:plus-3-domain-containing protein [Aspergillus sclerotioniger CBS 115572]|uniref:Plus-3-domain-containing protein n=1 Tax=Aspergillus sclerotioniger CBS 115572 TaxID=1450535 RepID=A0A317XDG5_9EURO|nr:plus-3-domain-containing protein [Aspergillus sclerotioniger CBS 115572]PWY96553.1 plus-3-domain-containing protein [Aspergillus sclerotioniger CBS 115572]